MNALALRRRIRILPSEAENCPRKMDDVLVPALGSYRCNKT